MSTLFLTAVEYLNETLEFKIIMFQLIC